MPKRTAREMAAHLTQAYRTYDGSAEKLTDPDVRNLEFLYSKVSEYLEDHKGSDEMKFMYSHLKDLTSGLRECSESINNRTIDSKTLDEKQEELGQHVARVYDLLSVLSGDEKNLTERYFDHLDKTECTKGRAILHASGEQKSAAKWIEEFQKDIKPYNEDTTPKKVAMIFAARQLADAKFGKRANIDKNKLSMVEIDIQTAKLMASKEFQEYAKNVLPKVDPKTLEHGHGGRLEQTFEKFLAQNPAEKPREFDLHGRYKEAIKPAAAGDDWVNVNYEMAGVQDPKTPKLVPEQNYKDYADYIKKNVGQPVAGSKLVQAARMAAANDLSRKNPEAPFDKKALQERTQKFMKDKNFKIMVSDPQNVDKLLNGDFVGFATEVNVIKTSCENMIDDNGQLKINGYPTLSLDRLEERMEKMKKNEKEDLKPVVDSVYKLLPSEGENVKLDSKDVLEAVGSIVDYQNKHATDSEGEAAENLMDSMRLLHELTKGSYLNTIVDDQMNMINGMRSFAPDHPEYMNRERIAAEGIEAEKQERIDLGIDKKPEVIEKVEGPNKLDKSFNYGNNAPVM